MMTVSLADREGSARRVCLRFGGDHHRLVCASCVRRTLSSARFFGCACGGGISFRADNSDHHNSRACVPGCSFRHASSSASGAIDHRRSVGDRRMPFVVRLGARDRRDAPGPHSRRHPVQLLDRRRPQEEGHVQQPQRAALRARQPHGEVAAREPRAPRGRQQGHRRPRRKRRAVAARPARGGAERKRRAVAARRGRRAGRVRVVGRRVRAAPPPRVARQLVRGRRRRRGQRAQDLARPRPDAAVRLRPGRRARAAVVPPAGDEKAAAAAAAPIHSRIC